MYCCSSWGNGDGGGRGPSRGGAALVQRADRSCRPQDPAHAGAPGLRGKAGGRSGKSGGAGGRAPGRAAPLAARAGAVGRGAGLAGRGQGTHLPRCAGHQGQGAGGTSPAQATNPEKFSHPPPHHAHGRHGQAQRAEAHCAAARGPWPGCLLHGRGTQRSAAS